MGTKIRNKIIDDFNKSYECKLTPEDIISKTTYFEEVSTEQYFKYQRCQMKIKYAYSCLSIFIICVTLSMFGLIIFNRLNHKTDYSPKIEYVTHELSPEDKAFMEEYVVKNYLKEFGCIAISELDEIIIFRNEYKYDSGKYIYFYKVINKNNQNFSYILNINDKVTTIDNNNSIGILTITDIENGLVDELKFSIIIGEVTYNYELSIPKSSDLI